MKNVQILYYRGEALPVRFTVLAPLTAQRRVSNVNILQSGHFTVFKDVFCDTCLYGPGVVLTPGGREEPVSCVSHTHTHCCREKDTGR